MSNNIVQFNEEIIKGQIKRNWFGEAWRNTEWASGGGG